MKSVIFCFATLIMVVAGWLPRLQQQDTKIDIKKRQRDMRYSNSAYSRESGWPGYSKMPDGSVGRSTVSFVDMDSEDAKTPEAKAAWVNKITKEHALKRHEVICGSTVIVYGKITSGKGYITSDDSSIYTVYNFLVSDIYRAPQSLKINIGDQIEVTAPGGIAEIGGGKSVGLEDPLYTWLAPGIDHILALKYDSLADDYYIFDPIGVYKIFPDGVMSRGDSKHPFLARKAHLAKEPASLEAVIQELKMTTCSANKGE